MSVRNRRRLDSTLHMHSGYVDRSVDSMLNDDVPIFNLRAVVQETGIKPDTLRAWERRYGLPIPKRTEGGHRLYSRRDIETVKWLLAQRKAGLGISKAVALWKQLDLDEQAGPIAAGYDDVQESITCTGTGYPERQARSLGISMQGFRRATCHTNTDGGICAIPGRARLL